MVCGALDVANTGLTGPFVNGRRRGIVDGIDVMQIELSYSNSQAFVRRSWAFISFAVRTLRVALSRDYDVVMATSTPLTIAIPAIIAKLVRRRAFVFEVRDLWPELPKAMGVIRNPLVLWLMGVLESTAYRTADGCIGLAPGIVEGILRRCPNALTTMIPNGADSDVAGRGAKLPSHLTDVLRFNAGKTKCIYSGAHGIANGLDAVLDAAAQLKKRGRNDIIILLIGTGMKKAALVARARIEDLDNCVFLDPVPKQVLFGLQLKMDIGLMVLMDVPAFYNGTSPNKFFDYLTCGLPVVINYPGWLADIVASEQCGKAVRPGSALAFADALEALADSAESRRAMGARARDLGNRDFGREQLANRFVDFLELVARNEAAH